MTTSTSATVTAVNGIRVAIGICGGLALIVGILILALPSKTAMAVTVIIAIYTIIAGLTYACLGIFSQSKRGWARVGHVVLGVVLVVASIVAFMNLSQTTAWLAVFLGVLLGIVWIVEGIIALSTVSDAPSKGWSVAFAILSIVAGIVLMFSPLWGVLVLWWLLGISLVVLGFINVVRAFKFGSQLREVV